MDTSWGYWWGGRKLCLILLLDDYSRYILSAQFVERDSAEANMAMIRETVERYGTWKILYTDNASFFKAIRHNKSRHQAHASLEYETAIGRACSEAGITHLTHKPFEPQAKGKIERIFRFIQERLVSQLTEGASLTELNDQLRVWCAWYNTYHRNRTTGVTPKERLNPSGFSPLPAERNLEDIFCRKDTRKVDSCNEFSFEGVRYCIPKEHCMVAFKVALHIHKGKSIRVWHKEQFICELPYLSK